MTEFEFGRYMITTKCATLKTSWSDKLFIYINWGCLIYLCSSKVIYAPQKYDVSVHGYVINCFIDEDKSLFQSAGNYIFIP